MYRQRFEVAEDFELLNWIFYSRREDEQVMIDAVLDDLNSARLVIKRSEVDLGEQLSLFESDESDGLDDYRKSRFIETPVLDIAYTDSFGGKYVSRIITSGGRARFIPGGSFTLYNSVYLSDRSLDAISDVEKFSRVLELGRENDVVDALKVLEPKLRDLVVLVSGRETSIAGDIGLGRRIPIAFMGQGFSRVMAIVCSIISSKGGVLLVDEVENGLHHSVLSSIWGVILHSAVTHDVQVFATTHSLEAINAAVEGSQGHEGSLAFYRLERRGDDIGVITGEDSRLRTAVSVGTELR